jgi:hypothetical protein
VAGPEAPTLPTLLGRFSYDDLSGHVAKPSSFDHRAYLIAAGNSGKQKGIAE